MWTTAVVAESSACRLALTMRCTAWRTVAATVLAALASSLFGAATRTAFAQERTVTEPPNAQIERVRPGAGTPSPAAAAGAALSIVSGGEAVLDLNIQYTQAKIYNPGTDQYDQVKLRSYRDAGEITPPKVPFVAPTVEIFPGETVRITLNNKLEVEPNCAPPGHEVNTPNCFNRTNLHSHGLWVSPAGNSDNVLISINPGVSFQYEYNVPPDHPAGTFWYHPHRHGSTALQVGSGMAGALIVRGVRFPTPQSPGDVDTLLKNADGSSFRERLVLLQQIQYSCRDANNQIRTDASGLYLCEAADLGGIEDYSSKQFSPGTWRASGRYTSINGEVIPTFTGAQVGRIERWRIIHAGVRDTVNLQFRKMRLGAEPYARLSTPDQQDWLTRNCPGAELLPQFALAADGLTRAQLIERTQTTLQPGYREDLLIVFPEDGDYCVLDGAAPAVSTVNNQAKSRQFLGRVSVSAGPAIANIGDHIESELIAATDLVMPMDVRQRVRNDLTNGLRLTSFVAHPDINDSEIKPPQREAKFQIGPTFKINGNPYDPGRIDQLLPLGGTEEWKLSTVNAFGHPFHIHVNPFQISRIINDATGEDVSVAGDANESQYANLKGVWKDTLFVRQGYTFYVRTRYRRYIGDFVLHCHILDHEDQGMMQNVRIGVPDDTGGIAEAHQH
jgi:L-ascorbate oxidase